MTVIRRADRLAERRWKRFLVLLCALLCVSAAVCALIGRLSRLKTESLEAVEQAVLHSAGQCYAVEGVYPSELSYLEEHYGLTINHSRYVVTYEAFSSNLPPDVQVLPRGGGY